MWQKWIKTRSWKPVILCWLPTSTSTDAFRFSPGTDVWKLAINWLSGLPVSTLWSAFTRSRIFLETTSRSGEACFNHRQWQQCHLMVIREPDTVIRVRLTSHHFASRAYGPVSVSTLFGSSNTLRREEERLAPLWDWSDNSRRSPIFLCISAVFDILWISCGFLGTRICTPVWWSQLPILPI